METHATVPVPARRKLAFVYDGGSRRIRKTVWHGNAAGTWDFKYEHRFVHELGGWNIQAELKSDGSLLRTFVWGTDLSGNFSGAGGVGGLLFTNLPADKTTHAHGYDLNGNVILLVNAATGEATATYDYGPFGEPIRQSGEYAKLNPYRFSTKYADDETGLLDYGYRYYDAVTGRWPSRDPIEERGGLNAYAAFENNSVNRFDWLGLSAEKYVSDRIWEALLKMGLVVYGVEGGMYGALEKLNHQGFGPQKPTYRFSSFPHYEPFFVRVNIRNPETTDIIVHELVHAFNWKGLKAFGPGDRIDEGMAYGMQAMYNVMETIHDQVQSILSVDSCEIKRQQARRGWRSAWAYGRKDISGQLSSGRGADFPLVASDFDRIRADLGAKTHCREIAKRLNAMSETQECCIEFSCEKGDSRWEFGSSYELSEGKYVIRPNEDIHPSLK